MARVTFSAMLSGASGKIGDVVASRWKGIAYFRRRVIPANPQSGDQCKQRHILKCALLLWQSVKVWTKPVWDYSVSGYALSGYNKFMDECMGALKAQFTSGAQGAPPTHTTPAVTVLTPFNVKYPQLLAVQDGSGGANTFTITWTARAGVGANNMVNPYFRLDDAFAWTAQTPVLESAATVEFDSLEDTESYEFALVPEDTTDEYFGLSSHQIGVAGA
ncbi:hypothetical protein ES703_26817 [subsurface metagenome]